MLVRDYVAGLSHETCLMIVNDYDTLETSGYILENSALENAVDDCCDAAMASRLMMAEVVIKEVYRRLMIHFQAKAFSEFSGISS